MFVLRTGLQGHSKTLNTIKELDERSVTTGRPVYFHNIRGLDVDKLKGQWVEFDEPTKWFELPDNAIAVIDEGQTWFGVRPQGTKVPEYASRLETMRHKGHELHVITQNPTFIDAHMRKLCNEHIHYNRPHKGQLISRWQFERPINPDNKSEFQQGQCTVMRLDKNYFDVYVSSTAEHHFKWRPPRALFVLVGALMFVGFLGWKIAPRFLGHTGVEEIDASKATQGQQQGTAVAPQPQQQTHTGSSTADRDKPKTRDEWIAERVPRVPDIPSSAPMYDDLTKPVSYPKFYCIATRDETLLERHAQAMTIQTRNGVREGCRCNTQQGSRLNVSFEFCMNVVQNGYFDPAKPDIQAQPRQLASAQPVNTMSPTQPVSQTTIVPDGSYASRPWR